MGGVPLDWITITQQLGFPMACLIGLAFGVWKAARWSSENIAKPLVASHLETLRSTRKTQQDLSDTQRELADHQKEIVVFQKELATYQKRAHSEVKEVKELIKEKEK